jgi:hypothetical protein
LEAYAKGFGFKEIPSRLMLQVCFAEKKHNFQRARQIIILSKELEGKQAKAESEILKICTRISQNRRV